MVRLVTIAIYCYLIDDRSIIVFTVREMNKMPTKTKEKTTNSVTIEGAIKPRRGRRPKALADDVDTKALLIRSGLEHLTEFGFTASGIDRVLKRVGVPKGSFYYYFASKEAFGKELIDSYDTFFSKKLDVFLLDEAYSPVERLARYVDDAQKTMKKYEFKRGCLIGNLGQEVDSLPESYRGLLLDVFLGWQQRVEVCLRLAQKNGELSVTANCKQLAEFFWIAWEGAVSRAKLVKSYTPLANFFGYFLVALSAESI